MQVIMTDILYDSDDDILFKNGDIMLGKSDQQHIQNILRAAPGHYRQFPLIGANIREMLHGDFNSELKKQIHLQLEMDGYAVNELNFENGDLRVDAERVSF